MKRSPYANELVREWVSRGDDYVCIPGTKIENKIYAAWIAAHPQKPFVISSHIKNDRRAISVLCTRCADIHNFSVPSVWKSLDGQELNSLCSEEYQTEEPYIITDGGIKHKHLSRRVKTYETVSTEV